MLIVAVGFVFGALALLSLCAAVGLLWVRVAGLEAKLGALPGGAAKATAPARRPPARRPDEHPRLSRVEPPALAEADLGGFVRARHGRDTPTDPIPPDRFPRPPSVPRLDDFLPGGAPPPDRNARTVVTAVPPPGLGGVEPPR